MYKKIVRELKNTAIRNSALCRKTLNLGGNQNGFARYTAI